MRKLISVTAVVVLAACIAIAPAAIGKPGAKGPKGPKGPKLAGGSISLTATPSTVTATTTTVTAIGNVFATSGCRKDRTVRFSYATAGGSTPLAVTAETGPNGDFSAVLPKPTDAGPATVTLLATTDETDRKVGSKKSKKGKRAKKGRKIVCLSNQGQATLTVAP